MPFEAFAIVELMGHQKIAGKVSEQVVASSTFLRVDVPKVGEREAFTKLYSANAVYCITPTDEATAVAAAQAFEVAPVSPYILRMPESPALAAKVDDSLDDDGVYWSDELEDDDDGDD